MKLTVTISKQMKNPPVMSSSFAASLLAAGLLVSGFVSQNATAAGLVFDLRATNKNGVALSAAEAKSLTAAPGDNIEIGMWAIVTGAAGNALPEGMQSALGKTISTHSGGFGGNQNTAVLEPLFVNTTLALPTALDLNADTFLDFGSATFGTTNSTAGDWFARSSLSPGFQTVGTAVPDGTEFKLFHFTYTVAAGAVTGFASIQWTQQVTGTINSAAYSMDGSTTATTSKGIGLGGTSLGSAVVISAAVVPEPSAFGMLALGALGLVGFRRMGLRRTA